MISAILLTPRSGRDNAAVSYKAPISVVAGLVGAVIVFVALKTDWATVQEDDRFPSTAAAIGDALLDPFVLPFEVASVLFSIGLYVALSRRNAVGVLMGIELMLNAVNLNLVGFARFVDSPRPIDGQVFSVFVITVAAAEAAVALALAVAVYRLRQSIAVDRLDTLKW